MEEFDNQNRNDGNNRTDNDRSRPNPIGKVPEYNFWAEQMPAGAYPNYNPNGNMWENKPNETKNNRKKGGKALKFVLRALCFGIIASLSFIGFQKVYYHLNPEAVGYNLTLNTQNDNQVFDLPSNDYKIEATKPGTIKTKSKSAISDVVNNTMASIVSINSTSTDSNVWFGQEYSQPMEASGSGIVVGKNENELLIATNNHVVAGTQKITVTFIDGKEAEAVVKGTDASADLAVITVDISQLEQETLNDIQIAKLGNSDQAKVGEMTIAIGNALGYGQSVTVGYISAKDREVEVSDGYESKTMILLQTDAAINPGNSGGALLNANGEVIGINTVKYASNEVEGMGYAIPISRATPIINELMNRELLKAEEQGFLGITGNDVTEDVAESYNMPIGVYIYEVSENAAADKAGLLKGDVITYVNDIEVTSITQLRDYVNSLRAGTEVKITYMRSMDGTYKENVANVTLEANPTLNTPTP